MMADNNIRKKVGNTLRSPLGPILTTIPLCLATVFVGSTVFDNPDSKTGPQHDQSIQQMETASANLTTQKEQLDELTEQLSYASDENIDKLRIQHTGLSNSFAAHAESFMNKIYTDGNLSEEDALEYYEDLKDLVGNNPPTALDDDMALDHYDFTHLRDARIESLEQGFRGGAHIQNTKSIMEAQGEDFGLLMTIFYGLMGGFIGSFGIQSVRNMAKSRRFKDWENGRSSLPFSSPKPKH